mmetsp:Transcript_130181/g.376639  ORF Transcript_130181/g.376639 Transcript_130181/m.376639 type:complete len:198 (-) Transcript_130181:184-777(-)
MPSRVMFVAGALLLCAADAAQVMKGENGQDVLGCRCRGKAGTHGYCGYHFHWGSQEDTPWCRTMHSCGEFGIKGSWMHCDPQAVEMRRADDGKLYNSKQFKEHYDAKGKEKWAGAEKMVERRMAKNGKAYTVFDFRDYYVDALGEQGWVSEWLKARPEQRQAKDGTWYTWEDFVQHYGDKKARDEWLSAKIAGKEEL